MDKFGLHRFNTDNGACEGDDEISEEYQNFVS
jgi:hypothetical protein